MKKIALLLSLSLAALAPVPLLADEAPVVRPAQLSAQDQADLSRLETYLNGLKNISADFVQADDSGTILRGKLAIARPGKMRVTYDAPDKDFIIADGSFVHIWNDDLKAQTNVEQGSSLAEFILRDPVKLTGDVTVTKFTRPPGRIEITLVQSKDPASGSLTLVFEDKPLQLRQWRVLDAQGHTTQVSLENISTDVSFPGNTFFFVAPTFGNGKD